MIKDELKLLDELYEKTKEYPDKALFLSVIFQALLDVTKPKKDNEATNIQMLRDQSSAWFFASIGVTCENFEFICDYAGVNPKDMRRFAFHVINSDTGGNIRSRILTLLG
tara:strand:+ start:216 stop:545 length:330 start_codon:yes stop_codon:yes gene_type:complete